jgi:hypothetical protein
MLPLLVSGCANYLRLLAECPNRSTDVVAKTDEKGCDIVQIPVLGEAISFAYLVMSGTAGNTGFRDDCLQWRARG